MGSVVAGAGVNLADQHCEAAGQQLEPPPPAFITARYNGSDPLIGGCRTPRPCR